MNSSKSINSNAMMTASLVTSNKSSSKNKKVGNKKVGNLYHIMDLVADDNDDVINTEVFIPSPRKQLPSFINIVNSSLQLTDKSKFTNDCKKESKNYWLHTNSMVNYSNKLKNIDVTDVDTINMYAERKKAYDQYIQEEEENRERIIERAKYDAERSLYELTKKNRERDPIVEQKNIYREKYHNVGNSILRASVTYNSNYVGIYRKSISAFADDDNNNDNDDESINLTPDEIIKISKEPATQVVNTPRSAMLKEIVKKRMMPFIVKDLLPPIVYEPPKPKKQIPIITPEQIAYFNTVFSFLSINPTKNTFTNIEYSKILPATSNDLKRQDKKTVNSDNCIGKRSGDNPIASPSKSVYKDPAIIRRQSSEFKNIKMTKILEKINIEFADAIDEPVALPYCDNIITLIDLRNQGLGDDKASCLASALPFCPNVTSIDISGNRLTDISVHPILVAMLNYMKCTSLNLSDNKLDDLSIDVLKDNLQDPECRIKELYLSKSDIDDNECAEFIFSIAENKSLLKLDLSNNLIGEMEDYNTVFPDFITGPEAISEVILMNNTLLELNLSWNNIRKDSAMTLALAIGDCKSLQNINLANNNLGDLACQHLFYNLRHNKSLKKLDLSYNSIYPKGITVLANILDYNTTLDEINVNGNSIGKEGGKSLLRSIREAAREKRSLLIHFRNGNMHYDEKGLFCRDKPGQFFELDLDKPYEWAVANSLLQIAMAKATASFTSLSYKPPGKMSKWETIKLQRLHEAANIDRWQKDVNYINECIDAIIKSGKPTEMMKKKARDAIKLIGGHLGLFLIDAVADRVRQSLMKIAKQLRDKVYMMFRIIFRTVFKIVDKDGSGSIDEQELGKCLLLLGIKGLDAEGIHKNEKAIEHARRMIGGVDVDRSGTLDEGEFERMLFVNYTETSPNSPPPLVDIKTSSEWKLPDSGLLKIDFFYDSLPPTVKELQTDESVRVFTKSMTKVLHTEEQKVEALSLSFASDLFLTCEQAEVMIQNFKGHDERWLQTVQRILPNLVTTFEACRFLAQNMTFKEIMMLRMRWGSYFRALTGIATGHYSLDFTMPYDRLAGRKLGELNNLDKNKILSESQTRNTSQSLNWENFRNESFNGKYKQLNSKFFQDDPQVGKIRFDFVVTTRPVQGIIPVSDDGIAKMLDTVFSAEDLFPTNNNNTNTTETNATSDSDDSELSDSESKTAENTASSIESTGNKKKGKFAAEVSPVTRRKAFINIAAAMEVQDPETIAKEKAELQMKKEREISVRILKKKLTSQWHEIISTNYASYLKAYEAFLSKKVAESRDELEQNNTSSEPVEETPSYLRQLYNTKSFKEARKTAYFQVDMKQQKAKDDVSLPGISENEKSNDISLPSEILDFGNSPGQSPIITPIGTPKMTPKTKSKKTGKLVSERDAILTIQKCISFENYLLTLEVYMIYNMWISCSQLVDIYNAFKYKDAPIDVLVRVVCIVFSRIVDLENFGHFLEQIPREAKCEVIHRLGILNVWCPMKPDGLYELDLACKDHREVLKLLIKLAVIEPGQNAFIEKYFTTRMEEPKRDLEIPPIWADPDDAKVGNQEGGPPRYGYLIFKYTSDPQLGCIPSADARRELTQFRTLAGTRGTFIRGFDVNIADIEREQQRLKRLGSELSTANLSNDEEEDFIVEVTAFDTFVDDSEKKKKMSTFQKAADGKL